MYKLKKVTYLVQDVNNECVSNIVLNIGRTLYRTDI